MKSQVCLMPAKCVNCQQLFDLSYDYNTGDGLIGEKEMTSRDSKNKLLCWECRIRGLYAKLKMHR